MSKPKKSNKSAKIPQPIKIKKEKTEEDRALYSMAHYVDDRLELVKQIFGSLKTKTITNLAPEYLKEKEMEEIQELCLNELLCLSKKRLLSIINATKCPTDTESSDEDSDVQAKEEHVSLEEISSDSEIENGGKSSKKPKKDVKKDAKKPNATEEKAGPPGQMSVLELLELQARARAIRSQLALEPVTKIEVDSDDEPNEKQPEPTTAASKEKKNDNQTDKKWQSKRAEKSSSTSKEKSTKNKDARKSKETETVKETPSNEASNAAAAAESRSQRSKQKIKIKRNFRNGNQTTEEPKPTENSVNETTKPTVTEKQQASNSQEVKREKRSPSLDVIPVVVDPEVLSISDSSSEEENSIVQQETATGQAVVAEIDEETEDGEIVEMENEKETTTTTKVPAKAIESSYKNKLDSSSENNTEASKSQEDKLEASAEPPSIDDAGEQPKEAEPTQSNEAANPIVAADKPDPLRHSPLLNDHDGDHSDDVISIEGGDLETEMSEHLDEDASSKQSVTKTAAAALPTVNNSNDDDVVSLDSSENDEDDENDRGGSESWQSRYMRSSKVHKVLAVSRLGKRVRDKLKTSKRSKKDSDTEKPSKEERSKSSKYVSKHEDGSIDQYKELIQMSQRKS